MELRVLAVGDVVGEAGVTCLRDHLSALKRLHSVDFTVVNGENAAGVGILPRQAQEIFNAGADVITLGNHCWDKMQILEYLEDTPYLLRPANGSEGLPGRGFGIFEGPRGLQIAVVNLMGRLSMNAHLDSPFHKADAILNTLGEADVVLLELHAEATSEKGALAWYLDGRVQALWGTHTHVPTADVQILPGGCGFVTDLGMTGPQQSVLGLRPEQAINRFLGGLPERFAAAAGPCKLDAVLFVIDTEQKRCTQALRCDIRE